MNIHPWDRSIQQPLSRIGKDIGMIAIRMSYNYCLTSKELTKGNGHKNFSFLSTLRNRSLKCDLNVFEFHKRE
jgi:hypothetical protein